MSTVKITLLGNLGQDATVREINGRFAINFSIADNKRWTDADGIKREQTTWYGCTLWKDGREKTRIAEYLKAGQVVLVEGAPEVRTYKNKDGQTVAALNVNVQSINFAGAAPRSSDQPAAASSQSAPPPPVADSFANPDFNGSYPSAASSDNDPF